MRVSKKCPFCQHEQNFALAFLGCTKWTCVACKEQIKPRPTLVSFISILIVCISSLMLIEVRNELILIPILSLVVGLGGWYVALEPVIKYRLALRDGLIIAFIMISTLITYACLIMN